MHTMNRKRIILGYWDNEPIWRYETAQDQLIEILRKKELEREQEINKMKSVDRKREIELTKLDNENCEEVEVILPTYKPSPKPKVSWLKHLKVLLP